MDGHPLPIGLKVLAQGCSSNQQVPRRQHGWPAQSCIPPCCVLWGCSEYDFKYGVVLRCGVGDQPVLVAGRHARGIPPYAGGRHAPSGPAAHPHLSSPHPHPPVLSLRPPLVPHPLCILQRDWVDCHIKASTVMTRNKQVGGAALTGSRLGRLLIKEVSALLASFSVC